MKLNLPAVLTAGVFAATVGGSIAINEALKPSYPNDVIAVVPAETIDSMLVDYNDGAWHFTRTTDGYGLAVDCPSEDSCDAHYSDGAWTVTRIVP